jgi:hypothetical protein
MMKYIHRIIPTDQVEQTIRDSLREKKPFALIRINDGENRFLGHGVFGKLLPSWLPYTGIDHHNKTVRSALLKAIKGADMVGLPTNNNSNFRPLAEKVLTHYKLNPPRICSGKINIDLYKSGAFKRFLPKTRIILLGSTLSKVASVFTDMGATIVGMEPVHGFKDMPRVLQQVRRFPPFDLALISAGFPAKSLCVAIRNNLGKVALDIGHIPEYIMYPNEVYLNVIRRYLKQRAPRHHF